MRTAGWLSLSFAVAAGLTVAVSRAAEELPASANAAPTEANAPPTAAPPASVVPVTPKDAAPPPSVTIIGASDAHGVLGRDVRSAADEDMGHIVDVIVDLSGHVRAAVIDFGGFLGVGSRKIVVDWNALRFGKITNKKDSITLELTKAQVAAAPEYKEDMPMVVLGASGSLQPLQAIQ
ncbi:PRC-barrel domain-containing protein [Bradyrhizobium sp. WYCCWR 13023]|uniref:PRC-barrel domain-containing protein n=1 Tax=Bradyrhizobium zhengyangense TaxID=2911009 RepID=A0A9X1U5Z1_9BRAD|nr:PRC-barrel domain-containing protein [Bradyrhizobium zhengyangense]MCG2625291.1 PRC-barrel domain-containing protein [Bradyrhizobium zhengyangense]MCG2641728.1 PRC-barrel domain-containing protein [Bradyrhizobium zhengyangense]MCG2667360.1 PRC-barrel domain-containing protein [Bradyrhizobium zhengyangense]